MTLSLADFTNETQLLTTVTTLVSASSSEVKQIAVCVFTNTSALAVEVVVYRILTASTIDSASGGNWIDKKTIQPGKAWACDKIEGQSLGNNMSAFATAGTAGVVNANLSGIVES